MDEKMITSGKSRLEEINLGNISALYEKYIDDLREARAFQRRLYGSKAYSPIRKNLAFRFLHGTMRVLGSSITEDRLYRDLRLGLKKAGVNLQAELRPQLDDLEAEITYLLMREFKPDVVVEISPCGGWSSCWILNAMRQNGRGRLFSFDIVDDSTHNVPKELSEGRWSFFQGDIKSNLDKLPPKIDYLFIDSDHSAEFAEWYIANILPKIGKGTPVSVHDVFHTADPGSFDGEGVVIIKWLENEGIKFFTASNEKERANYEAIMSLKKRLGIVEPIDLSVHTNPAIFFIKK